MTEAFSFQLNTVDYTVIVLYLALLLGVGFVFKRLATSMRDYFVGGSKVAWWMVGASMFMQSFSCWTFTGAAGFAYRYGILIIFLFWANALSFIVAGIYMAPKMRQTRATTWLEIIYERFGRVTEQVITWIRLPLTIFSGGIWLMSFGLVVSIATGISIQTVILVTGLVVVVYVTVGGSWGVMATDFVQSLMLLALAVALFVLSFIKIGGPGAFLSQIPAENLKLISPEYSGFWIAAYFIQIFTGFIGIQGAPKFLAAKDGHDARKAAFLAGALFIVGPVIWFVPPMIARCLYPDIGAVLPAYSTAYEGSYILMGLSLLPHGLTALLIMIMFAATVSTMDIVVNQNASMTTINFYKPFIRPKASDHELYIVGHFLNVFFGVLAMYLALLFTKNPSMDLFQLNVFAGTVLGLPIGVTCALIYFVRHCPRWAGLFSVISGMLFSVMTQHGLMVGADRCVFCVFLEKTGIAAVSGKVAGWMGVSDFSVHQPWPLQMQVFGMVVICVSSYLLAGLFHRRESSEKKALTDAFYRKMDRPVDFEMEVGGNEDMRQLLIIGILAMIAGAGICLLTFFAGSVSGSVSCVGVGGVVLLVGILLHQQGLKSGRRLAKTGKTDN
jgi:SSS family transporter